MVQIQIVDDHKMFVEGLSRVINESGFAQVSNTAHSVNECWEMLATYPIADVMLLDIFLPDGNGMELCPLLKKKYPNVKILALSSFSEDAIVSHMLAGGASGYILKSAGSQEVFKGIQAVLRGGQYVCEEISHLLRMQEGGNVSLTPKERELLRLICEGLTSAEIARKMFFSVETISSYRRNLLYKLGAHNTASLVRIAVKEQLI
ncbi:DNA-binding response regulator [Alphaproteobacteria bacterium]|nr:DNA-binding response regulator [Alphaproteobacteria bacterium]